MLLYLKIAFRNLLKTYQRSIKTILTIVIGLSACLLAQGFISHTLWGLRESLINGGLGHIQIYQKGFLGHGEEDPFRYLMNNPKTVYENLKSVPGIKLYAPRLNFQGIISSGEKSVVFMGTAGMPRKEQFLNTFATLKSGSFLRDDKPYGITLGSGMARKLNVCTGDTVTLMSTMRDGGVNAIDVEIVGIIEVQIKAYNDVVLFANLPTIQRFMNLPHSVDRIILLLDKTESLGKIDPHIKKICDQFGLEHCNWQKLAGKQYTQPKMFYDLLNILMMTIIVLVVIFSIVNTFNLTVQERFREIGTIRALGTTRMQVGKIFIAESFIIGLTGGFLGIIVGFGLSALFNALGGVPIPPPPGQARGYIALFRPDFIQALQLWMLFLITATTAGFYPAFRAARLPIVDALRWI